LHKIQVIAEANICTKQFSAQVLPGRVHDALPDFQGQERIGREYPLNIQYHIHHYFKEGGSNNLKRLPLASHTYPCWRAWTTPVVKQEFSSDGKSPEKKMIQLDTINFQCFLTEL